jgi:outer membrane protein assembly factor BamB
VQTLLSFKGKGAITMKSKVNFITLSIMLSVVCVFAADWPQYYGPKRDATSTEKGILRTWPKEGPKVLWTAPVNIGYGGPVVSGGKVYLLDRDDKVGDNLRCLDLSSGKEIWNFDYAGPGSFNHPGSRSVPTVDGNYVYTCGQLGDLYCINTSTHKPVWHKNVWTDFGGGASVPASGPPGGGAPGGNRAGAPGGDRGGAPGGDRAAGAPPSGGSGPGGDRAGGAPPSGGAPGGGMTGGNSELPRWGITQNPLIYGNLLIVASQTSQAGVVAYDKLTGEIKWKSPALSGATGYVTPSIVKIGADDHLVMIMASQGFGRNASGGSVNGLDPRSGKVLWTYSGWQCSIPIPHAVDAGEGRILITGAYSAGSAMIKVEKRSDGSFGVTELFKNPDFGAHTQPPILYKDNFYTQYTINERSDGLVCMGMDGKVRWKTGDNPLFNKGGMILVDGLLLATDGNKMVYVIDPDPSGFKPLASVELLDQGENWAPLALVDGKLLIRDQKLLKCLKVTP